MKNRINKLLSLFALVLSTLFVVSLGCGVISAVMDGMHFSHSIWIMGSLVYFFPWLMCFEGILFGVKFLIMPKTNIWISRIRVVDGVFGVGILVNFILFYINESLFEDFTPVVTIALSILIIILLITEMFVRIFAKNQ